MSQDKPQYQTKNEKHIHTNILQEDGSLYHQGEAVDTVLATLTAMQGCLAGAALLLDGAINEGVFDEELEVARVHVGGVNQSIGIVMDEIRRKWTMTVR
jgi:hypothetical protein